MFTSSAGGQKADCHCCSARRNPESLENARRHQLSSSLDKRNKQKQLLNHFNYLSLSLAWKIEHFMMVTHFKPAWKIQNPNWIERCFCFGQYSLDWTKQFSWGACTSLRLGRGGTNLENSHCKYSWSKFCAQFAERMWIGFSSPQFNRRKIQFRQIGIWDFGKQCYGEIVTFLELTSTIIMEAFTPIWD